MDILLYNLKNEIISIYTPNTLDFQNTDILKIKDESKSYKVVDIEKYRRLGHSEQATLEVRKLKI